jgi:pimeloyl-ACP methyl ester carboxylesterase
VEITVDGVKLSVLDQGQGEAVLLLHGFPDSKALYRDVIPELTRAGFRAVAFDQRGFGESDAPAGKRSYGLSQAAADALGVLDALGIERAHLVGHDWGAAVGWVLAGCHPDRFKTFSALSLGHARAYTEAGFAQLKKAWYIALVLVPGLGEWLVRAFNWKLFRIGTAHHPEAERWIADLSRPGRLTAGLNWYRANALHVTKHPRPQIPVLGVWSENDRPLTEAQMTGSAKYVEAPFRYERLPGASHWFPLDAPKPLANLLIGFFRANP